MGRDNVPVADALAEPPAAGAAVAALPQAAATSAEASGMPSLTGTGIRASNEWIIFIVSSGDRLRRNGSRGTGALSSCLMT